jgi:hypothetical protein
MDQSSPIGGDAAASPDPLAALLALERRARQAASVAELHFIAVNETHHLADYDQALLWLPDQGVVALSGLSAVAANAPFVQWFNRWVTGQPSLLGSSQAVATAPLLVSEEDRRQWEEWLPPQGLSIPSAGEGAPLLLLARDRGWRVDEVELLSEWLAIWHSHYQRLLPRRWWRGGARSMGGALRWLLLLSLLVALSQLQVTQTTLAPAEVVPLQPIDIRAPLDGVVSEIAVEPNQLVAPGALLLTFDQRQLRSRLSVARQELISAEANYRQKGRQAMNREQSRGELLLLQGTIRTRQADLDYLQQLLQQSEIRAPAMGRVMMDNPLDWEGRPVVTGERILLLARPGEIEIEAWVAPDDWLILPPDSAVTLFLDSYPLHPVAGRLRYLNHQPQLRPDNTLAYRLRASIEQAGLARIGMQGTARIEGGEVALGYLVLRRPIAGLRRQFGW